MPYLPYSKQCRMLRRSSVTMKLVADMICRAGASRLVSLDLYKKEIQGFFSIPVDNLRASPYLLQYIKDNIPDYKNAVIVAKSPGVMHKVSKLVTRRIPCQSLLFRPLPTLTVFVLELPSFMEKNRKWKMTQSIMTDAKVLHWILIGQKLPTSIASRA